MFELGRLRPSFTLQRASFVDEARIYETPFVPALDETFWNAPGFWCRVGLES
jgi:hypothetical protein